MPTTAGASGPATGPTHGTTVIWFRRDLRTADHPALLAAVEEASSAGAAVAPLFVVDDTLLASSGANRRAFLAGSLADLDAQLEGSLTLRAGRPEAVVPSVAAEVGASTVFATGDTAPYGRRRDARVAAALEASGATLVRLGSPYAVSPGRVRTQSGAPYRVFTPFRRGWEAEGWLPPSAPPAGVRWSAAESDTTVGQVAVTADSPGLPTPGFGAATEALDRFLAAPVEQYGDERDRPDHEGTSRLSPYLRFGTLHPRQVLARLPAGQGAGVFRSELAWREFYADVLWHHPGSGWANFQAVGDHLRWDSGPEADERFAAWSDGLTGFPLVDAGMRQLRAEGWMHNRVRMLTASFLVKDLHIDWRRGARHFLDLLVDGDLASNNHGWQWVAGTGTDAAPFHRVFNPTLQADRFDPDGTYVRTYVPEVDGPDYPAPLVDHAAERAEALRRWEEAKLSLTATDSRFAVTALPFGVYIHIPFCRARCDYCAFATYTDRDHLMETYAAACSVEVERAAGEGMPSATSVFFGGGTPSRLPADLLAGILASVPRRTGAEVTVECNPEDADAGRLAEYRAAGVNRISLGVQSTVPHVLAGLGRRHGSDRAAEAAEAVAAAGFDSWNMDLIIGGSGESDADWRQSLEDVLSLASPPPHLSAYSLTVEPGTPLAADPDRHPDEDAQAGRYEEADSVLTAAGYRWEEISNWSLPGHECRHNGLYWAQGDYRGIGSAAHSHRGGRRWWNVRTPDRYVAAIGAGRSPLGGQEVLTPEQRSFEALALALRTPAGVPTDALPRDPELDGLVVRSGGRAVLTVRGRLLANAVTTRLVSGGDDEMGGERDGEAVVAAPGSAGTIRPYA